MSPSKKKNIKLNFYMYVFLVVYHHPAIVQNICIYLCFVLLFHKIFVHSTIVFEYISNFAILLIDRTLTGTATPVLSGDGSNDYEWLLSTFRIFRNGASPSV